jgi:hypothetical protein
MGEVRPFKPKGKDDEETYIPCVFCHTHYPCHGQEFTCLNCPRVASMGFHAWEDLHENGWDLSHVAFKTFGELEAEFDEDEDEEEEEEHAR